jgi:dihydroxyacetone kinase
MAETAAEHEQVWGDLDTVAGDGDHGRAMARGSAGALSEAVRALEAGAGARTLLARAGEAWSESAGGTSGALWGAALTAIGAEFSDDDGATGDKIVGAVQAGVDTVVRIGGAQPGDKTMVDAMLPFARTLTSAHAGGADLRQSWTRAAAASVEAASATAQIAARRGRARTHGDRSIGYPDPGATSFALLMTAVAANLAVPSTIQPGAGS